MEEKEPKESEPEVHPCAEQTASLSLIISTGEEATQQPSELALGRTSGGSSGMTNGHVDEGNESLVAPVCSASTRYWSVTEGPDSPFLLSPIPGPSECKPTSIPPERASRSGHSRIPGRDHRRYYHEYWRSEYLMDFDPRRHGMICMVCGSSLATLKLSTIKRHIRQKHPDSLLWSPSDKEVIRSGWESHLTLERNQGPHCTTGGMVQEQGKMSVPKHQPQSGRNSATCSPPETSQELSGPSVQTLERYLNDSLHAWFRQEFLMEYQAEAGRLTCMVCGSTLPSLHLDHIKSHVLDVHPNSLVYSAEEKHCILQTWAQAHESEPLRDFFKTEPDTKDAKDVLDFTPPEIDGLQDASEIFGAGDGGPPDTGQTSQAAPHHNTRQRQLRGGLPWRLRLDYLVAYGPQGRGCVCMACSLALPVAKVSSFRRHIQDCHPETASLSQQEREAMANAWAREARTDKPAVQTQGADPSAVFGQSKGGVDSKALLLRVTRQASVKMENTEGTRAALSTSVARHGHYPGKDQRRNYQVRWRMEYLMDYDCQRHGLICMVCGATLATLKVSTIKRHIQQVHPHSLEYGAEARRQALLSYNQTALQFIHAEDCFTASDQSHAAHVAKQSDCDGT